MAGLRAEDFGGLHDGLRAVWHIGREIADGLRLIYCSPSDAKDVGFIETEHFGRRLQRAQRHFDLTTIPQRWLRDLLWEHLAELLRSPKCPRSRNTFDTLRRACNELGAFLAADAPEEGHNPRLLGEAHAQRFVADQRHRELHGLVALGVVTANGKPATVNTISRRITFNQIRKILFRALETGRAAEIGLDPGFIAAFPSGGPRTRSGNPFSDEVARTLADENISDCSRPTIRPPTDCATFGKRSSSPAGAATKS
ncbi:hypothetical protein [Nocardia neocaledoniensis]|uniref:hypothetical protein n=1 Tax=Nocardia neocaledoniensis TaxID=236511 RepID=UPI0024584F87|nr:hypothetical protein [Nocardia neocaledoniensis]